MSARDYESAMEKVRLDESARRRILEAAAAPAPRRPLRFSRPLLAAAALLALVLAPVALRGLWGGGMTAQNMADAGAPRSSAAAAFDKAEMAEDTAPQAAAAGGAQNETAAQPRLAMEAPQQAAQEAAKEENGMTPFARAERLAQLLGLELDTWTEQHDTARGPEGTDTTEYTAQAGDVLFTVAEEGVYAQGEALPEPAADAGVEVLERGPGGAPSKVFLPG